MLDRCIPWSLDNLGSHDIPAAVPEASPLVRLARESGKAARQVDYGYSTRSYYTYENTSMLSYGHRHEDLLCVEALYAYGSR
jgi:hypothetical protein